MSKKKITLKMKRDISIGGFPFFKKGQEVEALERVTNIGYWVKHPTPKFNTERFIIFDHECNSSLAK